MNKMNVKLLLNKLKSLLMIKYQKLPISNNKSMLAKTKVLKEQNVNKIKLQMILKLTLMMIYKIQQQDLLLMLNYQLELKQIIKNVLQQENIMKNKN